MKLLTENIESVDTLIVEATESAAKTYSISGPFMQAEAKNRNGRLYPKAVLEGQVNKYMSAVHEKRALGELNHPASPNVNLERASHLISELSWRGNDVYGKAKILGTPMGNIAKNLIDEGVKFGVSTRGMGTVKRRPDGINEVNKDFRLVCVDIVSDPSGPDCWSDAMVENAEWIINPITGLYEAKFEELQEEVKASKGLTLEQKVTLMNRYLKMLS